MVLKKYWAVFIGNERSVLWGRVDNRVNSLRARPCGPPMKTRGIRKGWPGGQPRTRGSARGPPYFGVRHRFDPRIACVSGKIVIIRAPVLAAPGFEKWKK
jgi:hypothetical protein